MPLCASENSYSEPTTQKGPVMKPTTFTTCDDNIPRTVLFMDARELERALLEHYRGVWEELDAEASARQFGLRSSKNWNAVISYVIVTLCTFKSMSFSPKSLHSRLDYES